MSKPKQKGWMPTSHAPTPALVRSLSRAGWGELGGHSMRGRRVVLDALVKGFIDDKTGTGQATEFQLSEASQYSIRWVRECLGSLEELGVIEWTRGGRRRGRGIPSFFKVVKARLVELIRLARESKQERAAAWAREQEERLARSGAAPWATLYPKRKKRRDVGVKSQGEVSADLLTSDEGGYNLPSSGKFEFQPDTHPDTVRRVNEAAINAHDQAKQDMLNGVDSASLATASGGGGSSFGSREAFAQLAQSHPLMAGKIERLRAARERKKQMRQ